VTPFPALLRDAQVGGELPLRELYHRYAPLVLGYLRGHGATDPEDLTSEVFIGMVRGLAGFSGSEESFRSWLLVIAHRRLLDERRRRDRRPYDLVEPHRITDLALTRTPAAEGEAIERLASSEGLTEALAALTPLQRDVVLLHTIGGLPLARVAETLGRRVGAVKSLHRRALATIARTMNRDATVRGGEDA
jgi:RNA polymerase sigma-70 factor (ECF subfamily)